MSNNKKKTTVENVLIQDLLDLLNEFIEDGYKFVNLENDPEAGILFMYGIKKEDEPNQVRKQLPPSTSNDNINLLLNNS